MKPGWKTSEFWITLVVMLLGAFMASGAVVDGHWSLQLVGLAVAGLKASGYTSGRAKVKVADSLGKPSVTKSD